MDRTAKRPGFGFDVSLRELDLAEPIITVGITCYREGEWLRECWESVLAQTDDRWTAVLVIGNADETTRAIFEEIQHPRLTKFAWTEDPGPHASRDKAFELTQTPYHFYLDADDQLLPDAVKLTLEAFAQHPDAAFVYGDYERFGVEDSIKRFPRVYTQNDLAERQCLPGACAYRVDAWKSVGGFAPELSYTNGDYDFHISLSEAGFVGKHCGSLFYRQRLGHPGQVSSSFYLKYHLAQEIIVRRHPQFFQKRSRRRRFLALGYRTAALANRSAKNHTEAARLAAIAIVYGCWRDAKLWRIALQRFLPHRVLALMRHARRIAGLRSRTSMGSHRQARK